MRVILSYGPLAFLAPGSVNNSSISPRKSPLQERSRRTVERILDELHLLVMHHAPRTHEIDVEVDRARSHLVDMASELLSLRIEDPRRSNLIARMVVATIDASVHDEILRQPRGTARRAAVDLTITTALSIIDSA